MAEKEARVAGGGVEGAEVKKVDLDTILVEELGQFGWFQIRMLLLTVVVVIFAAWANGEFNFTTARIQTRCLVPECEAGGAREFRPPWLANAIPASGGGFEQCARFANATAARAAACPAHWFDRERVEPCEAFVYENTDSVVYEYGLACEEWRRSLIGSVRTAGTLLALPVTGFVSDRWGRRVALTINVFNTGWLGVARYWADTYVGFLVSQVVEAALGSGGFSCAYILLMELMGPKFRVIGGASMNTCFSLGQILLGFIAWGVPNWRLLTLALYIPMLITIVFYWFVPESVRWYMSKGRYDESEAVLHQVARMNGTTLSKESLRLLRENAEEEKRRKALEEREREPEPWLAVQVFSHRAMLARVLTSPVWWITTTFIYYGMSINSVNMSGNRYMNYVAVHAVEIPGYWTAVLLMGRVGRKPVLMGAFLVCAACQIGYIFMPDGMFAVSLTVYLIGKYAIAMVMTTIYVYTAELYPTKYRHSLFAFSSMMGRIGSILAPLTPALGQAVWEDLPFALFAGFALLSGVLVMVTPETLGTKLPDTMEEAIELGKNKKVVS